MRLILCSWPIMSVLVLLLIGLQAEYGERGPKGEYLIDMSNPLWLVASGITGLLLAVGLKLLLVNLMGKPSSVRHADRP